jgi:hypothetical protein
MTSSQRKLPENTKQARVWVVQHERRIGRGSEQLECKLIGIYSTKKLAREAVAKLRRKPGFKKYPRGFSIGPMVLDLTYWASGFVTV